MKQYYCRLCKGEKTSEHFFKDKYRPYRDFLDTACKNCRRLEYRERRLRNKETYLKKDKKYYENHKEEIAKKRVEWYSKNKHKASAHEKVKRAVYSGTLIKLPCGVCGNVKAQAHHEDYNKPLDVMWLCATHHRRQHLASFT